MDMSQATVKAGGTDPVRSRSCNWRGVKAFTRRNLHAKIVVADEWVIAGSANISKHFEEVLDEAAILTNGQSAVRLARREFIGPSVRSPSDASTSKSARSFTDRRDSPASEPRGNAASSEQGTQNCG